MNAAPFPPLTDVAAVRAFITLIHDRAAQALEGEENPGWLQLVFIDPRNERTSGWRCPIGNVQNMSAAAVDMTGKGFNVYIEGRTVVPNAPRRGEARHTRAVFAYVVDSDADKGKAARLPLEPTMIAETSPGNFHYWFFLENAITDIAEAQELGDRLRAACGGDHNTGNLTQPYHVAGTPNYPNASKQKRGRITVEPTRIVSADGPSYSVEQLREAFPPVPKAKANGANSSDADPTRTGVIGPHAEAIARKPDVDDRSGQFHAAVAVGRRHGMGIDDLEDMFRRHPNGCAQKYLRGRDRLREEIERSWGKIDGECGGENESIAPTYAAGSEMPPSDVRTLLVDKLSEFIENAQAYHVGTAEHDVNAKIGESDSYGVEQIIEHNGAKPISPVLALKMTTGVGKTE